MREDMWSKFEEKEVKILVGSDIVSRGLDTLSVFSFTFYYFLLIIIFYYFEN